VWGGNRVGGDAALSHRKKERRWAVGCVKRKHWWDAIWALLGQRRKDWQVKEKAQVGPSSLSKTDAIFMGAPRVQRR